MTSGESDPRKAGTIWLLEMNEPAPVIEPGCAVTFHRAGLNALSALANAIGPGSTDEVERRLATGRRCYAAWIDKQLAGYAWVSFDEEFVGELNLWIHLQPGEAYIWDCATLPGFRNLHIYSAILAYVTSELRREGYQRIWIGANQDNLPSQRGIARAGFKAIADVIIARVLAMRMVWVIGHPEIPENLVTEARRVYLDNRDRVWLTALERTQMSPSDQSH